MPKELLNCPSCGDRILKVGHCYHPYCSEHRKKQTEELKPYPIDDDIKTKGIITKCPVCNLPETKK